MTRIISRAFGKTTWGSRERAAVCFGTAAVAALAAGVLAARIRRGATAEVDRGVRDRVLSSTDDGARTAAKAVGPLGKWYAHLPAALVVATRLAREGRVAGAVAVVASSLAARGSGEIVERLLFHRPPPPGRGDPSVQSFPSGHTLEPLAVALTSSLVLAREELAPTWLAAPAAAAALVTGAGRLVLDRHWVSDFAGGALLAVAVAGGCLGGYELAR